MSNSNLRNKKFHSISLRTKLPMSFICNLSAWEIGVFSYMLSNVYLYQYGFINIYFIF